MAETTYTITIGFKNPPHSPVERHYRITEAELHRLAARFNDGAEREVCDVTTEKGETRRLFLIFDEVVYIG